MSSSAASAVSPEYLAADKGAQILTIIIVLPSLALLVVGFRLYTRFAVVRNPSYEDLAIVLALIFSIATSICQGYQVKNGMGRHMKVLTLEQGIGSLKALFASIMMYNFGLTLTKVSIALQYIRIAIGHSVRKACWVAVYIILATCVETFFTGLFSCYPVRKFWDDQTPGGCVNKPALWYANAGINISTDIALIILPIFIIKKLQLRSREKYTLALILGLGGFASIASILRLIALHTVATTTDITWDNSGTATWSAIELNVGIICASLPTLRAFIIRHFPKVFRSTRGSTPKVEAGYKSGNTNAESAESDESDLIHLPDRRSSVATNLNDDVGDVERGKGTFFTSDSEQEYTSNFFAT